MAKYTEHIPTEHSVHECEVVYETEISVVSAVRTDVLDNLTPAQQRSLHLAVNQLNEGNYVPHDKVVKMADQWL